MSNPIFSIVDVFAEEKYAGNQLAVFSNVQGLTDRDMQRIAREMHFSETTFILSEEPHDGGYDVRIFTPDDEVPFAGHPTLGTAYVIQQEIVRHPVEAILLNLKVGQIPVTVRYAGGKPDMLVMKQKEPAFGEVFEPGMMSSLLGLDTGDCDEKFPIQVVSTGLPFIIVPLKTLKAVRRACVETKAYADFVKDKVAKDTLVFCPETYSKTNHLNVRVFPVCHGIPEDPATGSANGCLAGYLVKHRYFESDHIDIRVEQGQEIGRPSLLYLKAEKKESGIDVFVGGQVFLIARGELA